MKIELPTEFKKKWAIVEAELVDVAAHLAHLATFAVHRGAYYDEHWWIVTNVETGLKVSYALSKAGAIQKAREGLSTRTPESVAYAYRKSKKRMPNKPATAYSFGICNGAISIPA